MKKAILLLLALTLSSCVTVKMPKYLKDEFPYKKKFYASFDDTLKATLDTLRALGWRASETVHPSTFEQGQLNEDKNARQILIFTDIRQTPMVLSSRYMSLNVYLMSSEPNNTDVEIRYISVTPMLFKNVQSYKNDSVVYNIFDHISRLLEK